MALLLPPLALAIHLLGFLDLCFLSGRSNCVDVDRAAERSRTNTNAQAPFGARAARRPRLAS
jgi:hypothetical protein